MSSLPLDTQLTMENLRADFESYLESGDPIKAREVIRAMNEFSQDEAKRWEQELKELDV